MQIVFLKKVVKLKFKKNIKILIFKEALFTFVGSLASLPTSMSITKSIRSDIHFLMFYRDIAEHNLIDICQLFTNHFSFFY